MPSVLSHTQMYCSVKDGVIIDGPFFMPSTVKRSGTNKEISYESRGFFPYEPGTPPDYDPDVERVVAIKVFRNNKVVNEYFVQPMTDEGRTGKLRDLKSEKLAEVDAIREDKLAQGYEHGFGPGIGKKKFQTREKDRVNWLAIDAMAKTYVMDGKPKKPMQIRDADNEIVATDAETVIKVMLGMGERLAQIYATSWTHKDAIRGMNTAAAVRNYNIGAGWPP